MVPPLANNRLRWINEHELLFALKRKWDDGTTHILFSPTELIARLAAIVLPKGFNGIRYHGVLAPRSRLRPLVVPKPPPTDGSPQHQTGDDRTHGETEQATPEPTSPATARKRILWADLLRRVFRHDVELSRAAGGVSGSSTGPDELTQPATSTNVCRPNPRRSLRRGRRRRESSRTWTTCLSEHSRRADGRPSRGRPGSRFAHDPRNGVLRCLGVVINCPK
ncbi:MAG: transposase [Deltaproteobacteria bacterium]|nr:transposase [Deltaproteobacteria bacterium]